MAGIRRKLVIVGDGDCGKTCLLTVFTKKRFPTLYVPRIFEGYVADIEIDDKLVELALWDTVGTEEYDRYRYLSYPHTDVVLVCFSVDNPGSLENVERKWFPEIKKYCPFAPIIFVACKTDLRTDGETLRKLAEIKQEPVSENEGMYMATRIKAKNYFACSAKAMEGVTEIFEAASRAAIDNNNASVPRKRFCALF